VCYRGFLHGSECSEPWRKRHSGGPPAGLVDRLLVLVTHGGCAATPKDENGGGPSLVATSATPWCQEPAS
jgi:hypothetical protein